MCLHSAHWSWGGGHLAFSQSSGSTLWCFRPGADTHSLFAYIGPLFPWLRRSTLSSPILPKKYFNDGQPTQFTWSKPPMLIQSNDCDLGVITNCHAESLFNFGICSIMSLNLWSFQPLWACHRWRKVCSLQFFQQAGDSYTLSAQIRGS